MNPGLMRSVWMWGLVMGLMLVGVRAAVGIVPTSVRDSSRDAVRGATTRPGDWVTVAKGVKAQAYLGFWRGDDARPGDAAKVVRLVKGDPGETHFGVALVLEMDEDFTGELVYRETLTLPRKPATWDELNESLRALRVSREISKDGRTSVMSEAIKFEGGARVLPLDGGNVENMPTPFVMYDFDAGDPAGKWVMECAINDVKIARFEFEVIEGKEGEQQLIVKPDEVMQKFKPAKLGAIWLPGPGSKARQRGR